MGDHSLRVYVASSRAKGRRKRLVNGCRSGGTTLAGNIAGPRPQAAKRASASTCDEWTAAWGTNPASRQTPSTSGAMPARSEEHTSELQSLTNIVCRLLLEKKNRSRAREVSA